MTELPDRLNAIAGEMEASVALGTVANYIPELADVNPNQFAMSVVLNDGAEYNTGQSDTLFSIQSVSKVFSLAIALGKYGEALWKRIGREPSNSAFNSVVDVEMSGGTPRNPFMNAGAITVTDAVLAGNAPREALAEILGFIRMAAGDDDIRINPAVAESEKVTGDRNWALAYYLRSCGNLVNEVDCILGVYFHHCAIEMTCTQLARAGRFLAGIETGTPLISPQHVRSINALMMTCGHYDGSGAFAYRVGLPAKSGVGGGILAVVPGYASIAVWSPGLDSFGNSLRGTQALERLSRQSRWSVFEAHRNV